MKAANADTYAFEPEWWGEVLVVRCAHCPETPGSQYDDGSGVCPACKGAAWVVLAKKPAPSARASSAPEGEA